MALKAQTFPGKDGRYYWHVLGNQQKIRAIGGQGFTTRTQAKAEVRKLFAGDMTIEDLDTEPTRV